MMKDKIKLYSVLIGIAIIGFIIGSGITGLGLVTGKVVKNFPTNYCVITKVEYELDDINYSCDTLAMKIRESESSINLLRVNPLLKSVVSTDMIILLSLMSLIIGIAGFLSIWEIDLLILDLIDACIYNFWEIMYRMGILR